MLHISIFWEILIHSDTQLLSFLSPRLIQLVQDRTQAPILFLTPQVILYAARVEYYHLKTLTQHLNNKIVLKKALEMFLHERRLKAISEPRLGYELEGKNALEV